MTLLAPRLPPCPLREANNPHSTSHHCHRLLCAVWGITFATFLMGLPLMKGASAFGTCSSIATAGLCMDYALPIGCRLFLAGPNFEPGPFKIGRQALMLLSHSASCYYIHFTSKPHLSSPEPLLSSLLPPHTT